MPIQFEGIGGGGGVGALVDGPEPHDFATTAERDTAQAGFRRDGTAIGDWFWHADANLNQGDFNIDAVNNRLRIHQLDSGGNDRTAAIANGALANQHIRFEASLTVLIDVTLGAYVGTGGNVNGTYHIYETTAETITGSLTDGVGFTLSPRELVGGAPWLAEYDGNEQYAITITGTTPDTIMVRREGEWVDVVGSLLRGELSAPQNADVDARIAPFARAFSPSGTIGLSRIPSTIMRLAQLTRDRVLTVLGLTQADIDGMFVGVSINGNVITYTNADGTTDTVTLPSGGGDIYTQLKTILQAGANVTITPDDAAETLTVQATGGMGGSLTYTISINGRTITLTPSTGTAQTITLPDDTNTTYTIALTGNVITFTPSTGNPTTLTLPIPTWVSDDSVLIPISKLDAALAASTAPMAIAWKGTNNFVAGDFTVGSGMTEDGVQVPTGPSGVDDAFIAVWIGVSSRTQVSDIEQGGQSLIDDPLPALTAGTALTIGGVAGFVWASTSAVTISFYEGRRWRASVTAEHLGDQILQQIRSLVEPWAIKLGPLIPIAKIPSGIARIIGASNAGTALTTDARSFDFVGNGVTSSVDSNGNVTVTVPGGGGTAITYTISINGRVITLTPSQGNAQTITLPDERLFLEAFRAWTTASQAHGVSVGDDGLAYVYTGTVNTTVNLINNSSISWRGTIFHQGTEGTTLTIQDTGLVLQRDEAAFVRWDGSNFTTFRYGRTPTGGGTTLTADALLDLFKTTRVEADRNMVLAIAAADENAVALRSIIGAAMDDVIAIRPMQPLYLKNSGSIPSIINLGSYTAGTSSSAGYRTWGTRPTGWSTTEQPPDAANNHEWLLPAWQTRTREGWQTTSASIILGHVTLEDVFVDPGIEPGLVVARSRVGHLDSVTIPASTAQLITLTEDVNAENYYGVEMTDDSTGMSVVFPPLSGETIIAKTNLASAPTSYQNALIASILTTRFNGTAFTQNPVDRWNLLKGTSNRELYLVNTSNSDGALTVEVWRYPRGGGGGGSDLAVSDEGTQRTAMATSINFTGDGVTATSDASGNVTVAIGAGATPTPPSLVGGFGPTNTPTAALLTIQGSNGTLTFGALNNQFQYIGKRVSDGDITAIFFSDDDSHTNQLGAYTKFGSTFMVNSVEYAVWVSNGSQTVGAAVATVT